MQRFLYFVIVPLLFAPVGCSEENPTFPVYQGLDTDSPGVGLSFTSSPCGQDDCAGFIQVLWEGTLRVDSVGEWPRQVHEARILLTEVDHLKELTHDPSLLALLNMEEIPCVHPLSKDLRLHLVDEESHQNINVAGCSNPGLSRLSEALGGLATKYFPHPGETEPRDEGAS